LLSVIVPVFNVAPYLTRCLKSLASQTLKDIEIIIVNDGSTDGSDKICENFIMGKSQFRIIHKTNGGLMSAWMEGLKHINGEYIGFVDSDDYVDKIMFDEMYKSAMKHNADIVMCNRYDVSETHKIIGEKPIDESIYFGNKMKKIYSLVLPRINGKHITNARWNKIIRSNIFIENTIYCRDLSKICEDRFIVPACMFSARSFLYIDKPLYYYNYREGSNHSMPSPKLFDVLKRLYSIQKQMLIDKNLYEEFKEDLERANIDYIQILLYRNLNQRWNYRSKLLTINKIINDKDYMYIVRKYKAELKSKLGLFLRLSFIIKNPIISLIIYECRNICKKKIIRKM
jgi:glycosyltransferase involved in cell wall biosynthesis